MTFNEAQKVIKDAIAAHATFAPLAATTVYADLGHVASELEDALADAARGYSVSVWPATKGSASDDGGDASAVESVNVVRLQVSPQKLKAMWVAWKADNAKPLPSAWVNTLVESVFQAVKGIAAAPGGLKFMLAQDAFELVNFDEGLLAYHFRFKNNSVMGDSIV